MGVFNEQSFDHPFAKGIQGAPGVGFSLTTDGNYDISGKKNSQMLEHLVIILMMLQKNTQMIILVGHPKHHD